MSDTNSFTDAMLADQPSTRRTEGLAGAAAADDDSTGIPWQITTEIDAEIEAAKEAADEEEDDDDDEVVAVVKPPTEAVDDDVDEEFSDVDDSSEEDEPVKAKASKKGKGKPVKKSAKKAPAKEPKQPVSSSAKPVEKRIKWAKLLQEEVCEDGTTKTYYPFLEKEDYYLDALAVQVIISEAPHMAGYGKGKDAWLKTVIKLRKQKDPKGRVALPTITPKKLKARFDAWMSFVPMYRAKANRNSGTDDDLANNEVLDGIETMYDEKEAGAAVASGKRAVDAKKTANDKAGAEYLKCKAAGVPVPKEVIELLDNTGKEEESSDDCKQVSANSGAKKKRRVSTVSDLTASTQKGSKPTASSASKCVDELAQLGNAATIRAEAKLIDAKNKAEALKIKRMELEMLAERKKARMEAVAKNEEADRKWKQSMSEWFARQETSKEIVTKKD